jgi:8-oxo-dGTP pyrophosphatase MutT (NUDIX family)
MHVAESGGIVVTFDSDPIRVLVVKAKKNPNEWIFPKGHIETNESAMDAAVREVMEEAGIEAVVLDLVGASEFISDGDTVHVEYYLLRYVREIGSDEQRERCWCTYEEALRLLSFADARKLLHQALLLIEKHRHT